MRTIRPLAALLLIAAAVAVIGALLMPNPGARADTPAPPAQDRTATLSGSAAPLRGTGIGPDLAVLSAAAPQGEALTPAQTTAALQAADRVCEGLTAEVPEGFMIRAVADESGLPLSDAHAFVEAAMTRCGAL
jgi:molecular chaperone DnaK (HSP70)